MYVPQSKLWLLVLKEKHNIPIAGHSDSIKEVLFAMHERGDSPFCEDLCEMPNELSRLKEASRPLATVGYLAKPMA